MAEMNVNDLLLSLFFSIFPNRRLCLFFSIRNPILKIRKGKREEEKERERRESLS